VFDLQPGVDLQEEEVAARVQDELDGAGTDVPDRLARGDRCRAEFGPQIVVDRGGRRLLDDLLVTALNRALALEEVHDRAAVSPTICTSTCRASAT